MKSTCIAHPAQEPLTIIRQWQLEFCEGDPATAALLSFFEYWHNIKLEMSSANKKSNDIAEMHGEGRTQYEHLLQFHTTEELVAGIMNLGKAEKIRLARAFLKDKGVITEHKNPNPRFNFDKTVYYLFHPEVINQWLKERSKKTSDRSAENRGRADEIVQAITETTTEIKKEDIYISSKESEDFLLGKEKETERPEAKSTLEALSIPLSPLSSNSAAPPSPSITEAFQQLADAFVEKKLCSRRPLFTPGRKKKLATRLQTWSLSELLQAFRGYVSDKWWQTSGRLNIDYLLRQDEIVESGLERYQLASAGGGTRYQQSPEVPYVTEEMIKNL